jgi:hypothetical protein
MGTNFDMQLTLKDIMMLHAICRRIADTDEPEARYQIVANVFNDEEKQAAFDIWSKLDRHLEGIDITVFG